MSLACRTVLLATVLVMGACADASAPSESSTSVLATTTTVATPTPTAAPVTTTSSTAPPPSTTTTTTLTADPDLEAGTIRVDDRGVAKVWVPAGSFVMGTGDPEALDPPGWARTEVRYEQPAHEVMLSRGFWIDQVEVTNEAFAAFIDGGRCASQGLWSEAG